MLFGRKKYYFSYLSAVTAFITVFYLVFGPLFLSFESGFVPMAQGASITWVAGATGTWETGANWSSGVVPTSADDVTISSSTGNILVTLSSGQTANFNSLTIGGDSTYFATTTLAGNIGTGGAVSVNTKGVLEQSNFTNQTITGTLTVASGGKATHVINTEQTNTQDKGFVFTAPNFNFQSGSLLDAVGKGFNQTTCAGGFGAGFGPGRSLISSSLANSPGASHGGSGGIDDDNDSGNQYAYGDLTAPFEHGSSAARMHFDCGGNGGGTVKLTVTGGGTATISGTVTSTGTGGLAVNSRYGGGGSGGSIWINFVSGGTFAGNGTIGAGGGNALGTAFDGGGGGGGGRIAVTGYDSDSYSGTYYYAGGNGGGASVNNASNGGAGTLYKKSSSATYGDLYVNNASMADFAPTQTSSTVSLANIWLNGKANLVISTSTVLTITSSTLGIATASSTLDVNGTFTSPSTFTVPAYNQLYASKTQISAITDLIINTNGFVEIDSLTTSSVWVLDSLVVSGYLTHKSNSSTIENALMVSSTAITVNSGGEISATGRGYGGGIGATNGNGPGGGRFSNAYGGGGGYGGAGGKGNDASAIGGVIYGTTSTPEDYAGSGGAGGFNSDSHHGGAGGGVIKLTGTTIVVNGTVSANGSLGTNSCGGIAGAGGGGAGGGVRIVADTLSGSGTISANGFNGSNLGSACSGGGGGGGRVLVSANINTYSGTVTSSAGGVSVGVGGTALAGHEGSAVITPGVPYNLFSNAESAQTTSTNPYNIATTTPFFSAKFLDVEVGDTAVKAQIQLSTDSTFSTITHWDSGSSGTTITSCATNSRCQNLKYNNFGTAPTQSLALNDDADENSQTKYYWRIRYFDSFGGTGAYSTSSAFFTLLDAPNEPSGAAVSSITATGATISWTDNSNVESSYSGEISDDVIDSSFTIVTSTAANTTSFTTSTLSPDTRYRYRVAAVNSLSTSSYSTTTAFYTLANVAGTPTVNAASASSLIVTINVNNNPTTTAFAIYNQTTGNYVAADGSVSASAVYQTTSTWGGVNVTATGLSANTSYQFALVARNQSSSNSATSTASTAVYTLASVPTSLTLQSSGTSVTASWSANGNGASTNYSLEGVGNSNNSGSITNTSYTFSNLTTGQTYSFKVKAINTDGVSTAYTDTISITLSSDGGSAPASPPAPPASPLPDPNDPFVPAPDFPLDDFMPTGLIKVVSPTSGEVDLLKEAGSAGQLKIKTNADVKTVSDLNSDLLDLQNPFKLDFSFSVPTHPFWADAPPTTEMFKKGSAYQFGLGTNQKNNTNPGFCFSVNGNNQKVCDNIFNTGKFAPNKRLDYKVVWDGSLLKMYDGDKELSSKAVSNVSDVSDPLLIGGTSYITNNKTYISPYPMTIYQMNLKSEPILVYTNNPNVKLKIDAAYAPEFALKESDGGPAANFSDVSFNPVTSEVLWNFAGPDGKKCVNARFRSSLKKFSYDTFACVILDRIKPPAKFSYDSGYDKDNKPVGGARFFGVTEGDASVTLFVEVISEGGAASAHKTSETDPVDLYKSGSVWLAGTKPEVQLAASFKSQFSLKANKDGTWENKSSGRLALGTKYIASVQTRDLAGNLSNLETQEFIIGEAKPPVPPCEETNTCEPPVVPPCEETNTCVPPVPPCEQTGTCVPPKDPQKPDKPANLPNNNAGKNENSGNGGSNTSDTNSSGPVIETKLNQAEPSFLATTLDAIVANFKKIKDFVNNPLVQAINKKVVVPTAAALAVLNAALGFQLPTLINFLRYLFGQPAMILRRRKQKTWGVVYNSYTKEPIDLATVRLVDEVTGRVVVSQVTDFHGRYFLSANKGQFKLEVVKPGFGGFSEFLKEKDEDVKYANLYHGAAFYPPRDQFEINYNIPLDPIVENKPVVKILRDNLWEKIHYGISFAGLAASIMSFVVTPRWYTFGFICLHVTLFVLFYHFAHHKLPPVWGVVREFGTKNPVGRVVVRIFDSAYNKLVNTGITDSTGRYALLVGPSQYYVSYEKAGYVKKDSPILDYSSKKTNGMGGIINRDEIIEKSKPGKELDTKKAEDSSGKEVRPVVPKTDLDKVSDDINKWKDSN